jgi:hypothetical protein
MVQSVCRQVRGGLISVRGREPQAYIQSHPREPPRCAARRRESESLLDYGG